MSRSRNEEKRGRDEDDDKEQTMDLIGVDGYAELFGITKRGVYMARHKGLEPATWGKPFHGKLRWRREDLERYIAEQFADIDEGRTGQGPTSTPSLPKSRHDHANTVRRVAGA